MTRCFQRLFVTVLTVVFCVFVAGCLEDEVEIDVEADGSGTLTRTVTLSDRLIVSSRDDNQGPVRSQSQFPMSREELQDRVGDALTVTRLTSEDMADGSRVLHIEGSFHSITDLLASEFGEELGLRLEPIDGQAARLVWDTGSGGSQQSDITLNQMYGLAKGMYVQRTITLPTAITSDSGQVTGDKRTVTWALDLRDKAGLESTRELVGDDGVGELTATFDTKGVRFKLPQAQADAAAAQTARGQNAANNRPGADQADQAAPAGLSASLSAIEVKRSRTLSETQKGFPVSDGMTVYVLLEWPQGAKPEAVSQPKIEQALDDTGQSLAPDHSFDHRQSTEHMTDHYSGSVQLKAPANDAEKLAKLEGHFEVVLGSESETITLPNPKKLAGKANSGKPALDELDFKLEALEDKSVRISIEGGKDRLTKVVAVMPDGRELEHQGWGGWNNTFSYNFNESIKDAKALKLTVRLSERTAKVPFSAENVELP